jgi:2-methylcitrate dehydratase PrpD
MRTACATPT